MLLLVPYTLGRLVVTAQHVTTAPAEITKHMKHLLSLPYYGVFDPLTFNVDLRPLAQPVRHAWK